MEKLIPWQIANSETITKENVGEIMFTVKPVNSAGEVQGIKDLSKISIGLFLKRANRQEKKIFDGDLNDLLVQTYAGSTMLEVVKTGLDTGYNFRIAFGQFGFNLQGEDTLTVKTRFGNPSDAFHATSVLTGSSIKLYTNPSPVLNSFGLVPIYDNYSVGVGETSFEKNIGNNVAKITLQTDRTAAFNDSDLASVKSSRLQSAGGYSEDFTIDELLAKNQELLSANPDSQIRNLVHFNSLQTLDDVLLQVEYSAQAVEETKVLVTRLEVH